MKKVKLFEDFVNEALSAQDKKAIDYLRNEQDPKKIKDLQKAIGKKFSDVDHVFGTNFPNLLPHVDGHVFVYLNTEVPSGVGPVDPQQLNTFNAFKKS